jgi:ribose transport system ATP-binding protein
MTNSLRVEGLMKSFAGQHALDDVTFEILPGEVRGLIGQNGSGKSTLIKILSGFYAADSGLVSVRDEVVPSGNPVESERAGLRFVHQDLGLVNELDTVDNLALGHGYSSDTTWRIRWSEEARIARQLLERLGYDVDVRAPIGDLPASARTAVAIARALSPRRVPPSLLVLDEPTANLPAEDADRLLKLIRQISSEGVSVMFVSHHLAEVTEVADSITILRDGHLVGTVQAASTDQVALVDLMLGRRLDAPAKRVGSTATGPPALVALQVSGKVVKDFDVQIYPGQILGIAGITGSGREEIAGLVYGEAARTGDVLVAGARLRAHRPDLAVGLGMGLVPADRHANAALMESTVRDNVTIVNPSKYVRRGRLHHRAERADVTTWLERLKVRPPAAERVMSTLSGGSQQKVVLTRWLRQGASALVLDDPTQGVDVGAKTEIYDLIDSAAGRGTAVVVISSDEDELARLCDRVLVLRGGVVVDELSGDALRPDRIALASSGGLAPGGSASHDRIHGLGDKQR